MTPPLKVCYASSEVAPFAKTGGLADVSAALPRQLHREGHDVRVFLPLYALIDRTPSHFTPVEFVQNVETWLGPRRYRWSLMTAHLPGSDMAVYFVDCPDLYHRPSLYTQDADEGQRFALFCRAVIESAQRMGWGPDLFHCHDWHAALIPLLLRTVYDWDGLFKAARSVLTIHNIGYQGVFPASLIGELGLGDWAHRFDQNDAAAGRVNFLRTGLLYADAITTVSPTYASEIQTATYGMGLQDLLRARRSVLIGILNGVDYDEWSPENDGHIPHKFSRARPAAKAKNKAFLLEQLGLDPDVAAPLAGMVTRLTPQKGIDLCIEVLPAALDNSPLRLAVLGSGEARYEEFFQTLQQRYPGRVVFYRGYSNELAHLIEAGSDMFLMPSRYEPCGLNQMFSMRYGTIPIVRRTGGLADSVLPFDERTARGSGFVFDTYDAAGLAWALRSALRVFANRQQWRQLMDNAMSLDFSWKHQARHYVELYTRLIQLRA